jgi:hypothetical protein
VGDVKREIGHEYPPDGEAAAIAELRALHLMVHKVQPGPSQRGNTRSNTLVCGRRSRLTRRFLTRSGSACLRRRRPTKP